MVEEARDFPDFTNGVLLLGVDADGNQTGVLLDSDGNLNCILKGQGATGLQTISVDEDGRIEVFILDSEDQWGETIRIGTAELAGRLGSPVTFDWRGQVIWHTTFGNGFGNFYKYTGGTGAAITIDPTYSLTDGFALKLTGGSDGTRLARVEGIIGRSPSGRLGLCVAFSDFTESFTITVRGRPSDTRYIGALRYAWGTNKLQYLGDDAAYHDIGTVYLQTYPYVFHSFKLVIDLDTGKYVRGLLDSVEYDLSSYDLESDTSGYTGTLEYELCTYSTSGYNEYTLVDRVILTVNEP